MSEINYRGYQREAHERSRTLYDQGANRQLLVMATGTGKTLCFAGLPSVFPELAAHGILILVHRDELVFQAVEKFRTINPNLTVGIEKAEFFADMSSDVVVASVQTLGHRSRGRLLPILDNIKFGIVIVDEAHHMRPGSQYDRILNELGLGSAPVEEQRKLPGDRQRLLFGVTATPNRNDKVGLSHFFEEIVMDFGIKAAVDEGYLTDIEHYLIKTGTDISGVRRQRGDFHLGDLSGATNIISRNNVIVSAYKKLSLGRSAIMFCSSVEHAHTLAKRFRDAGVCAEAIDGTTPRDIRRDILRRHEDPEGDIDVITNFGVLTEGYDGRVHTIGMARPIKSQPLYIQMLGRGLRTIPADLGNLQTAGERHGAIGESVKPACVLLDFIDNGHEVITAPSLFGLNTEFDSGGKRLVGVTMRQVNSAIEHNPLNAEAIMGASNFEEVDIEATRINVWVMAKSHETLSELTSLSWQRIASDTVQLAVPASEVHDKFVVRLDQNLIGNWELTVIKPRHKVSGKWMKETRNHVMSYTSLDSAIKDCDTRINKSYAESLKVLDQSAWWRKSRPSDGQLKMLAGYCIDVNLVKTKGMASDLISAAKASGMKFSRRAYDAAA